MAKRPGSPGGRPIVQAQNPAAVQPPGQMRVSQRVEHHYEGELPPPAILRGFDELVPGTAQRMLDDFFAEGDHRRGETSRINDSNARAQHRSLDIAERNARSVIVNERIGLALSGLIWVMALAGAIYTAVLGQAWVAVALAAIPSGGMLVAYRRGVFERTPKPPGGK